MHLAIFSGFLGSGKTTLILALAKHLAAAGHLTCIVVNEVGTVGVDQQVMNEFGLEVWEITSGCICCSLGPDLVRTLQEISERFDPEVVIVEASGVALPASIVSALAYYRGRPFSAKHLVTLVDPTRLDMVMDVMTPFAEAQISHADEIVMTRKDEATAEESANSAATVKRLNAAADLWHVVTTDELSIHPLLLHLHRKLTQ